MTLRAGQENGAVKATRLVVGQSSTGASGVLPATTIIGTGISASRRCGASPAPALVSSSASTSRTTTLGEEEEEEEEQGVEDESAVSPPTSVSAPSSQGRASQPEGRPSSFLASADIYMDLDEQVPSSRRAVGGGERRRDVRRSWPVPSKNNNGSNNINAGDGQSNATDIANAQSATRTASSARSSVAAASAAAVTEAQNGKSPWRHKNLAGQKRTASGSLKPEATYAVAATAAAAASSPPMMSPRPAQSTTAGATAATAPGKKGPDSGANDALSTSRISELSAQLATRLAYAFVKAQNGWESRSLNEVETLAAAATVNAQHKAHGAATVDPGKQPISPGAASTHNLVSLSRRSNSLSDDCSARLGLAGDFPAPSVNIDSRSSYFAGPGAACPPLAPSKPPLHPATASNLPPLVSTSCSSSALPSLSAISSSTARLAPSATIPFRAQYQNRPQQSLSPQDDEFHRQQNASKRHTFPSRLRPFPHGTPHTAANFAATSIELGAPAASPPTPPSLASPQPPSSSVGRGAAVATTPPPPSPSRPLASSSTNDLPRTPRFRTPSEEEAALEQDAVETLLCMSSPMRPQYQQAAQRQRAANTKHDGDDADCPSSASRHYYRHRREKMVADGQAEVWGPSPKAPATPTQRRAHRQQNQHRQHPFSPTSSPPSSSSSMPGDTSKFRLPHAGGSRGQPVSPFSSSPPPPSQNGPPDFRHQRFSLPRGGVGNGANALPGDKRVTGTEGVKLLVGRGPPHPTGSKKAHQMNGDAKANDDDDDDLYGEDFRVKGDRADEEGDDDDDDNDNDDELDNMLDAMSSSSSSSFASSSSSTPYSSVPPTASSVHPLSPPSTAVPQTPVRVVRSPGNGHGDGCGGGSRFIPHVARG